MISSRDSGNWINPSGGSRHASVISRATLTGCGTANKNRLRRYATTSATSQISYRFYNAAPTGFSLAAFVYSYVGISTCRPAAVVCRETPSLTAKSEGVYSKMRSMITGKLRFATRQLAERIIWTHPSIARTFRCRPAYQASFKKTWLSLMWGGEPGTRRLRESVAVAISAANQCLY